SLILDVQPFSIRKLLWREFVMSIILFGVTFLITTPGAALQPIQFVRDVLFEMGHYASGHGVQTVAPGFTHFYLMLGYLAMAALSKYSAIALLIFLFAVIGAVAILRENWRIGAIFLAFPMIYVLYMSRQSVMFIRNMLVVFPFIAILSARGL